MNYYPFHVGDYATHTGHLEPIEDLAYRRMLDLYYLREHVLPADPAEVARLIRLRDKVAEVEAILREFFTLTDAGWSHMRCEEEIAKVEIGRDESKAKRANESERMTRFREARSLLFDALREKGVKPPWNTKTGELRRQCEEHGISPETLLQREQVRNGNAPATAIPIPNPIPNPIPRKERKGTSATRPKSTAMKKPETVPDAIWTDFMEIRKARSSPMTQTALDGIQREAEKAGMTMADALAMCCARGWQSFKAEWAVNQKSGDSTPQSKAARQAADAAWTDELMGRAGNRKAERVSRPIVDISEAKIIRGAS